MENDYNTILVRDSRLENISDKIDLPVYSGSPSCTWATFNANGTPSASSIQFSAQVPNSNVAVDRRAWIEAQCTFTYTFGNKDRAGGNLANGARVFKYGGTDALQSFPLNRMCQSAIVRMDNSTFSSNVSDNIPSLLRMLSLEELAMYQNGSPVFLDNYRDYEDNIDDGQSNNSPLSGYTRKSYSEFLYPRGCHPATVTISHLPAAGGVLNASNQVATTGDADERWTITIVTTLREPLFLSPFLWGNPDKSNDAAFLGVRNIDLNLALGNYERAFSSGANISTNPQTNAYSFALTKVENCKLYLNFMSLPSTLKLPPKFVLPYMNYTRYKTYKSAVATGLQQLTTDNIQLQAVPQMILIYVKDDENAITVQSADTFYPISNVSIQFAAKSGLMSSAQQFQLYKLSRDNGVQLDWLDWSGLAKKYDVGGLGVDVITCGSVLAINPAKDLSLDEILTNASGGSFNLQLQVTINNNSGSASNVDVNVLICDNGFVRNLNGSTSSSLAPLSADEVVTTLASTNSMSDDTAFAHQMVALGGMKPTHKKMYGSAYSGGSRSGGVKHKMTRFV